MRSCKYLDSNMNMRKELNELPSLGTLISLEDFIIDIYYKLMKAYSVGVVDKVEG